MRYNNALEGLENLPQKPQRIVFGDLDDLAQEENVLAGAVPSSMCFG
jgi:hypothetical protein